MPDRIPAAAALCLMLSMGCASGVLAQYDAEKAAVLAEPPPLADDWQPEVRIQLAPSVLEEVTKAMLAAGTLAVDDRIVVDGPMGLKAKVRPKVSVSSLSIGPSKLCDACLAVEADIDGNARFDVAGLEGKLPLDGSIEASVEITLEHKADEWKATASLRDIDAIELTVTKAGKVAIQGPLKKWVRQAVKKAPDVPLGTFGGAGLPLRAMTLGWTEDNLELRGATDVPGAVPVSSAPAQKQGVSVSVHPDTALAMARRSAFQMGKLDYDVAADPRELSLSGDAFSLQLRLWRLQGRGWWRDYTVDGQLDVDKGRLVIEPTEATEGAKSRGAGLVDPLALLVEGRILEAVADGLEQTVPLRQATTVGELRLVGVPDAVSTTAERLTLSGEVRVRQAK